MTLNNNKPNTKLHLKSTTPLKTRTKCFRFIYQPRKKFQDKIWFILKTNKCMRLCEAIQQYWGQRQSSIGFHTSQYPWASDQCRDINRCQTVVASSLLNSNNITHNVAWHNSPCQSMSTEYGPFISGCMKHVHHTILTKKHLHNL